MQILGDYFLIFHLFEVTQTENHSRRRLGIENKNFVICFVFSLSCTIFVL